MATCVVKARGRRTLQRDKTRPRHKTRVRDYRRGRDRVVIFYVDTCTGKEGQCCFCSCSAGSRPRILTAGWLADWLPEWTTMRAREMTSRCVTRISGPRERLQIRREMRGCGSLFRHVPFRSVPLSVRQVQFERLYFYFFFFYCPLYDRHNAILMTST